MRPILPKSSKPHERQFAVPNLPSPISPSREDIPPFSVPRASSESSNSAVGELATKPKAKRQVVSNACVPCRKRRSKCDGRQPCSKCGALDRAAECHFDAENDHRRKGALRKENEELKRKNANLNIIVKVLSDSKSDECERIVKRIKRGESFEDIAHDLRPSKQRRSEPTWVQGPSSDGTQSDVGYRSGDTERDESPAIGNTPRPSCWTNVTDDDGFVMELIDLYFTWQHPFFLFFDEGRFRADFASGATANCSPLLVNAVLATGCHFSNRPEAQDPSGEDSKGEHFAREAKRIFESEKRRPLTTLQALPVLAVREAGCGRDLKGRMFMSLAYRLICDPSYNLLAQERSPGQEIDDEAWRITFWGCYCLETEWSFGLGHPAEEVTLASRIPKPTPTNDTESQPWVPYRGGNENLSYTKPCMIYTCMNELIKLCEIIQSMTRWLYGRKLFKAEELIRLYDEFCRWRKELPEHLRTVDREMIPIVSYLHTFHRIAVLALFRPFFYLPFQPTKTIQSPRELASTAANEAADLLRRHQSTWGFRYANNMIFQFVIPLATYRQMEFPSKIALQDYSFAVKVMEETVATWPFGKVALLSMVNVTAVSNEKKKADDVENILEKFENLSMEEQTELSKDSDYYLSIVQNKAGVLASDFESQWRQGWTNWMASQSYGSRSLLKKPSIDDMLNR